MKQPKLYIEAEKNPEESNDRRTTQNARKARERTEHYTVEQGKELKGKGKRRF